MSDRRQLGTTVGPGGVIGHELVLRCAHDLP